MSKKKNSSFPDTVFVVEEQDGDLRYLLVHEDVNEVDFTDAETRVIAEYKLVGAHKMRRLVSTVSV